MAKSQTGANKAEQIRILVEEIMKAGSCCHLGNSRTNLVPGEGNPDAQVIFIGEGPGQREDELGRPFVGSAGKLLNELLASVGMRREDIYIANVLKCRPPGNRDPLPEEVAACWPWLRRQIEIIDPLLIVPLGRHAMERFLPGMKISEVRGKVLRRNLPDFGVKVFMPTYHPAAALYHREWLDKLEEDFRRIPRIIEYLEQSPAENVENSGGEDWDSLEIGAKKSFQQGKLL